MKYLIIGASIAGTTAAEDLKKLSPDFDVTLITKESYPLYSRITVASLAGGLVPKENLILRKSEDLAVKGINFKSNTEIIKIDTLSHIAYSKIGEEFQYDKLLIATGGSPKRLNIPGSDANGIFYMHTLNDGDRILNHAKGKKNAIVIGGAFIGIDFITAFSEMGLSIDFLIRGPYFLHQYLDENAGKLIHKILEDKGIKIHTNEEAVEIRKDENNNIREVITNKGNINCEVLGIGIGINRINPMIESIGIKTDKAIITNEYLQTTNPDIYAAGDAAQYYSTLSNTYITSGDWVSARSQAVCVAKNMLGIPTPFTHTPINTINLFGKNISLVGDITQNDRESYIDFTQESYRKVYTKDGIVVGGIVINNPAYTFKIKSAIEQKIKTASIDI